MNGASRQDMDRAFSLACDLNTFKKHLQKLINKYFDSEVRANYYSSENSFDFGIGLFLSEDNFISKVGHRTSRDIVYLGESVSSANFYAKQASRNGKRSIIMNEYLYKNFTDIQKREIEEIGGFSTLRFKDMNEDSYQCDWIINNYNNFVDNNS